MEMVSRRGNSAFSAIVDMVRQRTSSLLVHVCVHGIHGADEMTTHPESPKAEAPTLDEQIAHVRMIVDCVFEDGPITAAILASLTRLRAIEQAAEMPGEPLSVTLQREHEDGHGIRSSSLAYIEALRAHAAGLQARNAEMVAAAKVVLEISDRKHDAWDRLRAAIDQAEGGE